MNKDKGVKSLLIIDDDAGFSQVLLRAMSCKGFVATWAMDGETALAKCRERLPGYVLLDLNLAGQSGLNLIRPLLALAPDARVVVLTGYASIQTAVSALKLGAFQYLPKPANVADILHAFEDEEPDVPEVVDDRMTVQHLEWEYIQRTLAEHHGNITATARALKMHRRTLQRKLGKKRPPVQDDA